MENKCEVCHILPEIKPEHVIIDGIHWVANLRDTDQTLLGTTFITAKRHVTELDELSLEEDLEFLRIRNSLFRALKTSFQPLTINTSCLKNDAFKADPDNTPTEASHVHWHVKPRYTSEPKAINGEVFRDPLPGEYLQPSLYDRVTPSIDTAIKISEIIKLNLPQIIL